MVGPKVQVSCRDGSDTPLCLRAEGLSLVVRGGRGHDLITMLVHSSSGGGSKLRLFLGLLLNLSNLLSLS